MLPALSGWGEASRRQAASHDDGPITMRGFAAGSSLRISTVRGQLEIDTQPEVALVAPPRVREWHGARLVEPRFVKRL